MFMYNHEKKERSASQFILANIQTSPLVAHGPTSTSKSGSHSEAAASENTGRPMLARVDPLGRPLRPLTLKLDAMAQFP